MKLEETTRKLLEKQSKLSQKADLSQLTQAANNQVTWSLQTLNDIEEKPYKSIKVVSH